MKCRSQRDRRLFLLLAIVMVAIGWATQTARADQTKADNATSLDQNASWVSGIAPGGSDLATWNGAYTPANLTNALLANVTWGGICISNVTAASGTAGPVVFTNTHSTLTLNGVGGVGIDMSSATVDIVISNAVTVAGNQLWSVTNGRTLTAYGSVNLGGLAITTTNGGNVVIAGSSSVGSGWLILNGAGAVYDNSGIGSTAVVLNSGTLYLNTSQWMNGGGVFTINGGTLDSTNGTTTFAGYPATGNWNGSFAFGGSSSLVLKYSSAYFLGTNVTVTCNAKTLTVASGIGDNGQGYSLTKAGPGTLQLSGNNTYGGNTVISAGTLALATYSSLSTVNGSLNNSTVVVSNGATFTESAACAIQGAAGVINNGTTTLSGTNTYTGSTVVNGGTLALSGGGSIASSPIIAIASGATLSVSGLSTAATLGAGQTLQAGGSTSSATLATAAGKGLALAGTSPLQFTAFTPAGAGGAVPLTLSGAGTLTLGASTPVTITVANGGTPLTAAGSPYKLIAKGASGSVATLPGGPLTFNGDGANGTDSLAISNSELYLLITGSSFFTTTTLALTSGNPIYGNSGGLTYTATVKTNGIAAGNCTSNFVFSVDGVPVATNTVSGGSATYTIPGYLTAGSHLITAQYSGDATYKPSANTLTQIVNPLPVGLTGIRAYDGTANAVYGILTITNVLAGDSVFLVAGSAGLAGANTGMEPIISPNTLTLGGAQAGNYTVTGLTGSVLITQTTSSLLLASSAQTSAWQQPVTFIASVQNSGLLASNATGSVTFLTNGVPLCTNNLIAGTTFSLTTTNLPSGTNLITACYSGDANYAGSTNTLNQLVLPPQTTSVTFANSQMSITIKTNAAVTSVICVPTGTQMLSSSPGFYIYHQIDNTTNALTHMAQLNSNQLLLWSDNWLYTATFTITNAADYFKIALAHVSNNQQTGGIDTNWPGHEVVLGLNITLPAGYSMQTLKLDYMTEFPYFAAWYNNYNWLNIHWQNVQYSQRPTPCVTGTGQATFTVTNSEPMGAVGFYLFTSDNQHDQILLDMWSGEPCMARPNQANLTSWTQNDIWAWLDRYERELSSCKELAFIPEGTPNTSTTNEFYQIANLLYSDGFDRLLLWNCWGESPCLDSIDTNWFAGGAPGMQAYMQYCAQRGIRLDFHAMSGFLSLNDPLYGASSPNGLSPQVSRWATGTLLNDIDGSSTSFNVLPDAGCQMLVNPVPWGSSSTPIFYPPYYFWPQGLVSISNDIMYAQAAVSSTNWSVSGVNRNYIGQYGQQWGTSHKAGSRVDFLDTAEGSFPMVDSRSDLLDSLAARFATNVLNMFNLVDAQYDGDYINFDLGYWGYGKFATHVQQSVNHPTTSSYGGNVSEGHFEDVFRRIQKTTPPTGGTAYYIRTNLPDLIAPNADEMNYSFGKCAAQGTRFLVMGGHIGSTFDMINNFGLWDQMLTNMNIWMTLSPWLSASQQTALSTVNYGFYAPTVRSNQWQVTPMWVMARPAADSPFFNMQEFGQFSPRQFTQVGVAISGLTNAYAAQTPQIELLVLPGMNATNANNVSLMPVSASQIVHPANEVQPLAFAGGVINLSVTNNTGSQAVFTPGGNQSYWLYSSLYGASSFNMSTNRGVALTVVGDNSGADLVFRISASSDGSSDNSDYVVPINFSGPKTIEIPNGQVMYYLQNPYGFWSDYSTVGGGAGYGGIVSFQVYVGMMPAHTTTTVQISGISAMQEDQLTGLANPILTLNSNSVSISGTIPYNSYLTYSGGATAQVYDQNWHFMTSLAASGGVLMANNGSNNTFSVTAAGSPNTWLSTRIKTSGTPWVIPMPAPTHEWRFENNPLDVAGTANGTPINGPAYVTGIEGVAALSFNGVNQYVSITNVPDFQFTSTQSFTLSAWVKLKHLPNARCTIVQTDPTAGAWYGLGITAANQWAFFGTTDIVSYTTADAGQWHLLTAVQNGAAGSRKLFVDGLLMTTGLAQAASGTGALGIGALPGAAPSQFLNGAVDDVRIYNQALAPSDIGLLATNLASAANSIITYSVSGGQLVLDWPANQLWQLQMQTNSLGTGLTTNWFNVTGVVPPYNIYISPTNPTVFYRLIHP